MGSNYLIVGAGSAGCVMANRLSENPDCSVVLLEAGGSDRRLMVRMPSAFYMPVRHPKLNWGYVSEPETHLNGRRLLCPRGRVLGGSSSINGMVYVRGHRDDFDRWEALGARGWNYDTVLPYFTKAQRFAGQTEPHPCKGHNGPLAVTNGKMENPLYQAFLSAAAQAGHTLRDDLNDGDQEGFGALPMTVDNGWRASAARAYLTPVRSRSNLTIETHARALRLMSCGTRVSGVEIMQRGRRRTLDADHVIVCAGAIDSPALLLRSGIGPAQDLRKLGIDVVADLPGVGQNLMDHLEIYVQQACTQPVSLYRHLSPWGRLKIGLEWLTTRQGLGATNHFEAGGFIKSEPERSQPDIQFHFLPAAMQYDGSAKASQHGFQAHVGPMLSASRGTVGLRSSNPAAAPVIQFNYMSTEADWQVFRRAIEYAREIFAQPAFAAYRGAELRPGSSDVDAFIREHAESAYHPCGTCRMGADPGAVVDDRGRVHGMSGLSVVDASVFPHITNGNLNAPTIMLAERMADLHLD